MVLRRPDEVIGRGSRTEDLRKQVATYPSSRDALVDRLAGKDAAFRQSTGKAEALRAKLARGEITAPADIEQDVVFAGAVQALPTTVKPKDLESIRTILLGCLDRAQGAEFPEQQPTRRDLPSGLPSRRAAVLEEEIITLLDDNGLPEVPVMPASAN